MTHGKIIEHRTGKENQYGYRLAPGIRFCFQGGNGSVVKIWDFKTTGISLCQGGGTRWQAGSSARPEDCLHGQAIGKSYRAIAAIRPIPRSIDKRSGHRGLNSLSSGRLEAWSSRRKRKESLSWNIVLTGCHHVRSAKHTSFSCLRKAGAPVPGKKIL